ncbi:hypothetical protein L9F63_017395, partial [Diploptera punctata]
VDGLNKLNSQIYEGNEGKTSPHLYMSPSSHCDDIKAMNNFLPCTLDRTNFIGPVGRSTILLENDIRTLCRFTLPDKWKVASSEKKILVMKRCTNCTLYACSIIIHNSNKDLVMKCRISFIIIVMDKFVLGHVACTFGYVEMPILEVYFLPFSSDDFSILV